MAGDLPIAGEIEAIAPEPVSASPAALPQARSMLYLVSALVGGNVVGKLLRMVGGVLQARGVLPQVLGRFNGIGLVQGYAPLLQLGILNGLNRELPFYVGKGDRKRVVELAAAAQAWALLIGGQVGLALVGVAVWQLVQRDLWLAAGWATNAILVVLLFYNNYYLQMTYRTSHDFARLAMVGVVENAVALAAVLLVRMLSFYGLCLRLLLAAAVSTALLYYWRPVRVGPRWHFQHLLHLLIIGFPIFIVGELYLLWTVLDSTLVFWNAGDRGLGLYYLVITAIGTLEMLPMAVSQVIYPRMSESFGRTGKLGELVRMSIKPTVLTVAGMTAAAAAGWWLVGPVVRIVLPRYVDAVPATQWVLLVAAANSFAIPFSIYNVARRQLVYAVAIIMGIAAYYDALTWLLRGGVSLVAFPQAMLIGRVVFIVAGYLLLAAVTRRDRAR